MKYASGVERSARQVPEDAKKWVVLLARLGYAVRGIVYGLIGILALQAAMGSGSSNVDQTTVFQKILTQPSGKILLWIVVVGLVGYSLWRLILALYNFENDKAIKRVGYFFSAATYLVLAWIAYQLLQGKSSGGGNATKDMTANLLATPFGQIIVGLIGLVILGLGIYGIYLAFASKIEKQFDWGDMSPEARRLAVRSGRLGYAARGVVYSIIGVFLIQAALTYNPQRAGGLGEALQALGKASYGPYVLGAVAVGLIAFGIYALALARYRRIEIH